MLCEWIKWKPAENLASKYYIDSISDGLDGFIIVLSEANNEALKLRITFENSVICYRSTDESFRQETINNIDEVYGTSFYSEWTFFKISNSDYVQWLLKESYDIIDSESLIHFSILAVDSVLDIIAKNEPKVEVLNDISIFHK